MVNGETIGWKALTAEPPPSTFRHDPRDNSAALDVGVQSMHLFFRCCRWCNCVWQIGGVCQQFPMDSWAHLRVGVGLEAPYLLLRRFAGVTGGLVH